MNVRDWLYLNKVLNKTLAKDTGYSSPAVQLYLNFRAKIPMKFAKAVELYTHGQVNAEEMIEWSKEGIEIRRERDKKLTMPPVKTKDKFKDILHLACDRCKKKLTKAWAISK